MTEKKVQASLKTIETSYKKGFILEALLANYHLNIDLLKFIYSKSAKLAEDKKIKVIIAELSSEIEKNTKLKTLISKKNLKLVKVWASKMDDFFKVLKHKSPENTKSLFNETQKIFGVLNISAYKIFAHKEI
ncbi:MAG: hypothetical protein H0U95_06735 [Bacteroidetes bacterium]|nr:hypothetical protein [Bacteroidota bacterium]